MQIDKEQEKLLLDFAAYSFINCPNISKDLNELISKYLNTNSSFSLGKQKPLAKNKQTENSFLCYQETLNSDNRCELECVICRNTRLENECRDATSR